ncbi:MAG: signal peptide peptidase SppA [Brevinema sp.]
MKKNVLITLCILYVLGLVSAIVAIGLGNKQSNTVAKHPLNSISNLSKKQSIIGVINIDTPISFTSKGGGFLPTPAGADFWLNQMKVAETNQQIKAVLIKVNTPGGAVGASQELYAAVQKIQKAGKPVVVSVSDISASGGYYATASADRIFANGGSIVGSIGVIMQGIEYSELLTKIGVKANVIKSGNNKDLLSPFHAMSEEQKNLLTTSVLDAYDQFIAVVSQGRKMPLDKLKPLADGRIFTGRQALEEGLIDELGTFDDAVSYTKKTFELEDADVTEVSVPMAPFKFSDILPLAKVSTPKIELSLNPSSFSSPILYLYQY